MVFIIFLQSHGMKYCLHHVLYRTDVNESVCKIKFFMNLIMCANSPIESSIRPHGAILIGTLAHDCHTSSVILSMTLAAFWSSSKTP